MLSVQVNIWIAKRLYIHNLQKFWKIPKKYMQINGMFPSCFICVVFSFKRHCNFLRCQFNDAIQLKPKSDFMNIDSLLAFHSGTTLASISLYGNFFSFYFPLYFHCFALITKKLSLHKVNQNLKWNCLLISRVWYEI